MYELTSLTSINALCDVLSESSLKVLYHLTNEALFYRLVLYWNSKNAKLNALFLNNKYLQF